MAKVSVLIPSRGESEKNITNTLSSIYENFTGDYEVIIAFDGDGTSDLARNSLYGKYTYKSKVMDLKFIEFPELVGIKTSINAMAAMAKGKYIYKSDAHCRFSKGFDEVLQNTMEDDWIVTPRFKIIKDDWSIQMRDGQEEFYDYFYLCCPFTDPKGFRFKAGGHWKERTMERLPKYESITDNFEPHLTKLLVEGNEIDETPQIHGSGWFMTKDRYFELGGFPNIDPYGHAQEPIWLGLKNWLAGGKVMVNKNCWYAHLHQQGNKRGFHMDKEQENISYDIASRYWMADKCAERKFGIQWFVNKFMPMPTWPDNYAELIAKFKYEELNK